MTVMDYCHRGGAASYHPGEQMLEGEYVDADVFDVLTCSLEQFERRMAQRYHDWGRFVEWVMDRQAQPT